MKRSFASSRRQTVPPLWRWLSLAFLVVVLDQLTKTMVIGAFEYGQVRPITSFFNLVRVHNSGAAFSMLADAGGWQRWFFVGLGLAASAFMVFMLKQHGNQKTFSLGLTLIMGGAIGNVVDRLIHGHVIDFLDFYWRWLAPVFPSGHFPAFNVADCAISVGAFLLIWDEFSRVRHQR